jgi:hypothetical protein
MGNVEWHTVANFLKAKISECQRALESCPHEEVDLIRGRLQAYRSTLRLADPLDERRWET